MEDARHCILQIRSLSDQESSRECISMLTRIFQKISTNPGVEKFRSIKLSNEKFQRCVWGIEPAQFLLYITGFQTEESTDIIFLPAGIDISMVLSLLSEGTAQQTIPSPPQRSTLKLSGTEKTGNVFTNPTIPVASPPSNPSTTIPRGGLLVGLLDMGYTSEQASQALIETDNTSIDKAVEWINAHPEQHYTVPDSSSLSTSSISTSENIPSLPLVSRYQESAGERYAFLKKQREEELKAAMIEKRESTRAKENLMKNMECDKKHQQATRAANTRHQATVQLPTHAQAKPACVRMEEATSNVSIRVRLPNGSQNIIKILPDATVHELYSQVANISQLSIEEITLSIPFSQTCLDDHSLALRDCSLAQGGNVLVQLSALRGQVLAGEGRVYPTIVFTTATDFSVELGKAPAETLVVLMCTSSGSKASKEFEGVFDTINADLGMNREIIFMKVDLQAIPMLRGLQGHLKLPCFHFYKNLENLFSFSTHNKQELFDKIVYLKDKDVKTLEEEREKAANMRTATPSNDSNNSSSTESDSDDTGGADVGINDPR